MVLEGLRRIREDGHRIGVIDPDGLLGDRTMDDGTSVETSDDEV
jgi:glutaminase